MLCILWSIKRFSAAAVLCLTAAAHAEVDPFIFEVTFGNHKSYVLGSYHDGISIAEFPSHLIQKIRASKQVVLETDAAVIPVLGRNRLGTPLRELLSPLAWAFLNSRLGSDYSEAQLDRFEPWFAARELYASLESRNFSKRPKLDLQIQILAQSQNKSVYFLAPVHRHVELDPRGITEIESLATIPLGPLLREYQLAANFMMEDYRHRRSDSSTPEFYNSTEPIKIKLVDERNRQWLPQLNGLLRKDSTFIAVGLGHLFGPNGILQGLENQGFQVRDLSSCGSLLSDESSRRKKKKESGD